MLRVEMQTETSFDPGFASDAASDSIIANIFDAMLDYDYLARPVKLVPRVLETLPSVEDGGRTYVCRLRKGIHFTPDPAFKGKPRELTAADFAYSFKRILDPAVSRYPVPWLTTYARKMRDRFGDLFPYGIEENRPTWEQMALYTYQQGIAHRGIDDAGDHFPPPGAPAVKPCRAALRLLSASIRKFAPVTTRSPPLTPSSTSA